MTESLKKEVVLGFVKASRVSKAVHIPEWNGCVLIRRLAGVERDELDAWLQSRRMDGGRPDMRGFRAKLVQLAVQDEQGNLMFSPDELDVLNHMDGKILDKLADEVRDLNGIGVRAEETISKNSAGPSDGSGSASPQG